MYELLYCSMATREMNEADILNILKKAREKKFLLRGNRFIGFSKTDWGVFADTGRGKRSCFKFVGNH